MYMLFSAGTPPHHAHTHAHICIHITRTTTHATQTPPPHTHTPHNAPPPPPHPTHRTHAHARAHTMRPSKMRPSIFFFHLLPSSSRMRSSMPIRLMGEGTRDGR